MNRREKLEAMTEAEVLAAVEGITNFPPFFFDKDDDISKLGRAVLLISELNEFTRSGDCDSIKLEIFSDLSGNVGAECEGFAETQFDVFNMERDGPITICRAFLWLHGCIQERDMQRLYRDRAPMPVVDTAKFKAS